MREQHPEAATIPYAAIGRSTLFKVFVPSMIFLLFLPLLINRGLEFFGAHDRQVYSEYKNLYQNFTKPEPWFLIILLVQSVVIVAGIYRLGPKASRQLLEQHKGLFATGFKTALSIWVWMFVSVVIILCFFELVIWPKNSFTDSLLSFLFHTIMYVLFPYLVLALSHSLLTGYWIGRQIRQAGQDHIVSS